MKFENDILFASPVKSGVLKSINQQVYFLNGTAQEHNAFGKMIANEDTRQQGWQNAVYSLACFKDGTPRYKRKDLLKSDFELKVDRNLVREYGMLILGLSDDGKSKFDEEVTEELKNLEKENAH